MTVIFAALTALLMVVTGWAMFRRLARFLLAGRHGELSEIDLVLIGILPGLALVGTVSTYLALFHLLRFGVVLTAMIAILYVARREIYAMLVAVCGCVKSWFAQAGQGNFFPLIAVGAFFVCLAMALRLATIPGENVDIWVFHIPLAQSFVAHHGLAYPLIPKLLFYSSQPLLFELLYGTAMLAVPHFIAANAVNIAILFGFVFLLLSFAGRARDIQFLVLCGIFFWWQNFLLDATQPMIDLPRSCFSAAAYLFAYRYACNFRCFDLTMSALMAGAAAAGKYTELVTPIVICAALVPLMINKRHTWFHMIPAMLVFVVVAGVWYVKNAIQFGNPIFPFLFGHPGLSDQWMAAYFQDLLQPFDIADRVYSTNLLTVRGWHDFGVVLWMKFRGLEIAAIIALIGILLPQPRRWLLPLVTIVLFIFWYAVMFNGVRWAVTAILMLLASAFSTWAWAADRVAIAWNPQWPTMVLEGAARQLRRYANPWTAMAGVAVLVFVATGSPPLKQAQGHSQLPNWMSHDLAMALMLPGRMDQYLAQNRPGYVLYHYIGEHNLAHVLQPFDNGGTFDASSYNGGRDNIWVLYYQMLPANLAQTDAFVARNGVHYFVDRDPIKPLDVERLGAAHVALAKAVVGRLKPHSRFILRDGDMSLYEILPQDTAQ
jgi:hypothetical protein